MQRKWFLGFVSALALGVVVWAAWGFVGVTPSVRFPSKVGVTTLRLYDTARERPLVTEVWYPVHPSARASPPSGLWVQCDEARDAPVKSSNTKYPLIVMSHGNWGDRLNISWIAETLVMNGYVVVSMDHYGNTWNNKIPECFIKIWDRPQDVSFVIGQVLQDERIGPHIDHAKIGVVGYSLGGHTGIWIAGGKVGQMSKPDLSTIPKGQLPATVDDAVIDAIDFSPATQSYRDPRVSAVFVMAPALGHLFEFDSLQSIAIPVQIVAAEGDRVVPTEMSAKWLASKIKTACLTLIPGGADHYVFLNRASKGGLMLLDKRIVSDPPDVDRAKIHKEISTTAVEFFNKSLKG